MKEASWRRCLFPLYFTLTHIFLKKELKKYLRNISFRINGFLRLEKLILFTKKFNVSCNVQKTFSRIWCKSLEKYLQRNTKLSECWKSSIIREAPSNAYKILAPNKQVLRYIPLQLKFLLLFSGSLQLIQCRFFWGLIFRIASCLLYLSA